MSETMRRRFYHVTAQLLDSDPRIAVVLADIGIGQLRRYGVFERHPLRAINVGIREALMISAAAGMALEGMRPITHSYTPFLIERAFEQIKIDFSHQGVGGILVSIGGSYDASEEGRTHQAPEDVALISTLPDWTIHTPGHPDELEQLLRAAAAGDGAVYIRLSEAQNAEPHLSSDGGERSMFSLRRGSPGTPTILAIGPMLQPVLEATADLDSTLLYTHTPWPLDAVSLRDAVTGTGSGRGTGTGSGSGSGTGSGTGSGSGTDIVVVEPYLEGTSAAAITAALSDRPIRLIEIGVPPGEVRRYGAPSDHAHYYGLDAAGLRLRLNARLGSAVR